MAHLDYSCSIHELHLWASSSLGLVTEKESPQDKHIFMPQFLGEESLFLDERTAEFLTLDQMFSNARENLRACKCLPWGEGGGTSIPAITLALGEACILHSCSSRVRVGSPQTVGKLHPPESQHNP